MSDLKLSAGHSVILAVFSVFWAILVWNLLSPFPEPWDRILRYFLIGLAAVHLLELLAFHKLLGASGRPKSLDALLIFIAGAFHASWLAKCRAQRKAHSADG